MRVSAFKKNYDIFIFLIFALKIIYLLIEFIYNSTILDIVTSSSLDTEVVHRLEVFGHIISALGTTLLILGFIYKNFLSNLSFVKKFFSFTLAFSLMFPTFYKGYDIAFNYIIQGLKKKEEVYVGSFYLSLLRLGIVNGVFYYPSIIPIKPSKQFSIEDKIMLVNIYLLPFYDKTLLQKFQRIEVTLALENILRRYMSFDIEKSWKNYHRMMKMLQDFWVEYKKAVKELNTIYITKSKKGKEIYASIMNKIWKIYWPEYQKARTEFYKNLREKKLSESNVNRIYSRLDDYFKFRRYKIVRDKYRREVMKIFHHYIPPERWCKKTDSEKICPSKEQIVKVLIEESKRDFRKRIGLSPDLYNFSDFLIAIEQSDSYQRKLKKILSNYGLIIHSEKVKISSYSEFKKFYQNSLKKTLSIRFKEKMKKKLAKLGLPAIPLPPGLKKDEFIKYVEPYIRKMCNEIPPFISKKEFYKEFSKRVLPKSLNDLKKSKTIAEFADTSLSLIVIPPIALLLSSIVGLLNLISLLLSFSNFLLRKILGPTEKPLKKIIVLSLNLSLIFILLYYPLHSKQNLNNLYPIFKKIESKDLHIKEKTLLKTAEWLLYVEPYAYFIGKTLRAFLPRKIIEEYNKFFKLEN